MSPFVQGYPFSLSYGARLPSSLTRVISITLGLSSLPTRVGLQYGRYYFTGNEAFLDGLGICQIALGLPSTFPHLQLKSGVDLPAPASPMVRNAPCPLGTLGLPYRVPPLPPQERYGNIDPLSIAYAFRPRLRPD